MNVRSLVHKIQEIRLLLHERIIDCLCLTETWLHSLISDDIVSVSGYKLFRKDRPTTFKKRRGGGIAVYVLEKYDVDEIDFDSLKCQDVEFSCLKIHGLKVKPVTCVTIYRPPDGSTPKCIDLLSTLSEKIKKDHGGEIVFYGDFNINYKNRKCKWSLELKGWETISGLKQLITKPTRVDKTSTSVIDLCFTNVQHIHKSGVLDMNLSDHFPIFFIKKKIRETKNSCSFVGRNYSELSAERVEAALLSFNSLPIDKSKCPNDIWAGMQNTFIKVADEICPNKMFYIKHDKPSYFTDELKMAINERDSLYKTARLKKDETNWLAARKKKLEVRKLLVTAKKKFIRENLTKFANNPIKYWKTMGKFLKQSKDPPITCVIDDNNEKVGGTKAANLINKYFCCIGDKLASKIKPSLNEYIPKGTQCELHWEDVISEETVLKEIRKLNTRKSSGIPLLGARILKECLLVSCSKFTELLNICVTGGIFPTAWKRAMVVTIPKGNKKPYLTNVRPISLLPYPGKVLENIIHKKLYDYLEINNLICPEQSGFRRNYGILDPISDLCVYINRKFNEGKHVICVYIDLAKAFNSLDWSTLVKKLSCLGIRNNFLGLLSDYLQNREQIVTLNGILSDVGYVNHGVPQGSTLGPTLFSIYMNDLPRNINGMYTKMYADDTVLYYEFDKKVSLNDQLKNFNTQLEVLSDWCNYNKVTINVEKSMCMLFTPSLVSRDSFWKNEPELWLNGSRLKVVHSYRYLGMDLDEHLKFDKLYDNALNKARTKMFTLLKLRKYVDAKIALQIYKTYVLPIIEFGLLFMDNYYVRQIARLQKIQNKCLRICYGKPKMSPSFPLHTRAKLLPLRMRRKCQLLCLMNKKLIKEDGTFVIERRKRNSSRRGVMVEIELPKSERFKKSLAYDGPLSWNSLPQSCKVSHIPDCFKKNIKQYYLSMFLNEGTV